VRYLVAYDIADPRRLQRVARRMERHATRTQKSVFLFHGSDGALLLLLDAVAPLLDLAQDVVQAWKLAADQPPLGTVRGTPLPVCPAGVVLAPTQTLFVRQPSPESRHE
jgi:CRISPR-associated protein Cas2